MSQSSPRPPKPPKKQMIPAYMATFADLMTLLLCFFVLLLSMAELDILRYESMVESMENAFGVNNPADPETVPSAESVIETQNFNPLDNERIIEAEPVEATSPEAADAETDDLETFLEARRNRIAEALENRLNAAIEKQDVNIETRDDRVVIHIDQEASFSSGSANLKQSFLPVLEQISTALTALEDKLVVSGHTDNQPVRSGRFRSNWELSAARANSVLHALLENPGLSADRFRVEGYADTRPIASNDNAAGRSSNRRVEVSVITQ